MQIKCFRHSHIQLVTHFDVLIVHSHCILRDFNYVSIIVSDQLFLLCRKIFIQVLRLLAA